MINTAKNILTKESATDALKTQKEQFKKQQKQIPIWLLVKMLIKLQKSQKFHN